MIKEVIFKHQKAATLIIIAALIYFCYQFSFKKTIAAMLLHQKLSKEVNAQDTGVQSTLSIMEQKQIAYTKIIKSYVVKKSSRENTMWQTISGLALQHQVSISFQPPKLETDTSLSKSQFNQEYHFNSSYSNLIRLLDTLHHVQQIGKVTRVKIFKDHRDTESNDGLIMELGFVGLEK
ncbi:hypothetical protein GM921_00755 [Pedobacter sp. LMG 31464]|uniref:Tfp pilus assembly protein PilO n=1 Tax=Pedobacter planticolens TaxID=2679964 RepID=A0A923ISW3_9SPHI|nr:hypothetical protein [Pedobacter planticolens]MBB2144000.1 hypothetical protein [Pedobacter planticolens]